MTLDDAIEGRSASIHAGTALSFILAATRHVLEDHKDKYGQYALMDPREYERDQQQRGVAPQTEEVSEFAPAAHFAVPLTWNRS